jgi:prepilin-type N-terminal cleavage/methylation domain-containing protein
MARGGANAGYTLVEILVVLVIIGTVAAIGVPRISRDRAAADGREFAELITREMQRARLEAVSTRFPRYVFVFSDRIEVRAAKPGATPTAALLAPTTADQILRSVRAKPGVSVLDVLNATGTPSSALTTTTSKQIVFSTLGAGFIGPAAPALPTPVYVYIDNTVARPTSPDRHFRVDVASLTGFVQLRGSW